MKKIILSFLLLLTFSINSYSQSSGDQMNAVLEYQTGTWCQWCPCGHDIVNGILSNYPSTVVIAYHGNNGSVTDPWSSYSDALRPLFGFDAFPKGCVGRKSGPLDRGAWNNKVVVASFQTPGVNINITNKNYNAATRTFTCDVSMTARAMLDGNFSVSYILTEGNIIYSQTGNASCAGNSSYHHDHVVKGIINGAAGTPVVISGHWMMDEQITKNLSYVLPAGVVAENAHINIIVFKNGSSISTDSDVQQALTFPMLTPTAIGNNGSLVSDYSLSQNYPNPFNPVTNITFSIPRDGNVTMKIYDMLGNEIGTYVDEMKKSGSYTVTFDGANLASGIYYYKLEANGFIDTKKMMLIK